MKVFSRITGETFESTPEEQHAQRIARLRNRVWWGILNVSRETMAIGGRMVMVTLTYRGIDQWRPTQVNEFVRWWREKYNRGYVWIAELQKRGAVHYHFLSSLADGERWDKAEIEFAWYHGLVWVSDNIRKPWYLMKYLQKGESKNGKHFKKGQRIVGYTRSSCYFSDRENADRLASRLPRWVQECIDAQGRSEFGGLVWRGSGGYSIGGKLAVSPYSIIVLPDAGQIGERMKLALDGWMVYTAGVWELPQTKQLHAKG